VIRRLSALLRERSSQLRNTARWCFGLQQELISSGVNFIDSSFIASAVSYGAVTTRE